MDNKPRESRRKRVLKKLSRPFKSLIRSRGQSVERSAIGQAQEGSASLVDLPDRRSSPPPGLPKETGQIGEALVLTLSVPALSAIRPPLVATDPITDLSVEPLTSQTTPLAVTEPSSAASAPLSLTSRGLAEPSSAARVTKVIVKGALGILSSAADGIPIPGVKAIFDTIIKVIGVIEVRNMRSLLAKMG